MSGESGEMGPKPLKSLLSSFINRKLTGQRSSAKIHDNWRFIMGKFSDKTEPVTFRSDELVIRADSAPVFHEVRSFMVPAIEQRLSGLFDRKIAVKVTFRG